MLATLKSAAFRIAPESVIRAARRFHYIRSIPNLPVERDLAGCLSLLKPTDTVLDVGANIGRWTYQFSKAVPQGRVYAFEPIPETFHYLEGTAEKLSNVTALNVAASDCKGSFLMTVPEYEGGGRDLYRAEIRDDGNVSIQTDTLDNLFPDTAPALIKCDVEGHEVQCINGARKMISASHPAWMIEVEHSETFELMGSLDYKPFAFDGQKFVEWHDGIKSANTFFF